MFKYSEELNLIDKKLLKKLSHLLKDKKLIIATAESATGGLIAHALTNISGSSDYFDRGLVTYSNRAKIEALDVSKKTLDKYGAVSNEVAEEMAEGVRKKSRVYIGISTTGIAGPTGGTKEKPVGTVYIGFSNNEKTISKKYQFKGSRLENKEKFCNAALQMIFENIR